MTTIYKPGNVPSDPRLIPTFLRGELAALKRGLESPEPITRRQVLHAPPAKAMDGDEIEADGVDWNPGYGPGKYVRRNGAWTRGDITGSTGTFSGALSAATGTFAGSLSAATGTFAGSLSAATGTFAGSLSAATGTFSGNITGTANINITGAAAFNGTQTVDGSGYAVVVNSGGTAAAYGMRIYGSASGMAIHASNAAGGGAIYGTATSGTGYGVYGYSTSATGTGVIAGGTGGATALKVEGPMTINNTTKVANLNADLLDGNDSSAFATAGHNHSGTYLPVAGTAADSSALGGYAASSWTRIVNGNVGTANASGAGFTMQMGTGLAPTYEVNCSSNNIILQTASDRRMKRDIEPEARGLDFVLQLAQLARQFRFISDPQRLQHGWIAQDVESLVGSDATDALVFTNPNGMKGVNHLMVISILTKAVATLHQRIAALEARP